MTLPISNKNLFTIKFFNYSQLVQSLLGHNLSFVFIFAVYFYR